MKFQSRKTDSPIVCGNAPITADLSRNRTYRKGEQVVLRPEGGGLHAELNAVVLGMNSESVMVRALHPYFVSPTQRPVNTGDEFEVSRDQVFIVFV